MTTQSYVKFCQLVERLNGSGGGVGTHTHTHTHNWWSLKPTLFRRFVYMYILDIWANKWLGKSRRYRGADKPLGRKQANVSVIMAWISFGALPCRKKKNLMTGRFSMLLKSRASLTWFRACFFRGRAKDLSAPQYISGLIPKTLFPFILHLLGQQNWVPNCTRSGHSA